MFLSKKFKPLERSRVLVLVPASTPQVTLHSVQIVHSPITQSAKQKFEKWPRRYISRWKTNDTFFYCSAVLMPKTLISFQLIAHPEVGNDQIASIKYSYLKKYETQHRMKNAASAITNQIDPEFVITFTSFSFRRGVKKTDILRSSWP